MACLGAYISATGIRGILTDLSEDLQGGQQEVIRPQCQCRETSYDPNVASLFQQSVSSQR